MANHFPSIQEPIIKKALEQDASLRDNQIPFQSFQYVDAVFNMPNQDLDIPHNLNPLDPESINYLIVKSNTGTTIYQDTSGSRVPWQRGFIRLRSSAMGTVRLLLFTENTSDLTPFLQKNLSSGISIGVTQAVPFDANNFSANTGTWVVEAGDISGTGNVGNVYRMIGDTMWWNLICGETVITGTPSQLRCTLPGGFKTDGDLYIPCTYYANNVAIPAYALIDPNEVWVKIYKADGTNFANDIHTYIGFQVMMKVKLP